jgi:transposase-like protein
MSVLEKAMVLALVNTSTASKSQTLAEIGIPRRTYYNWVRQEKAGGKKFIKREAMEQDKGRGRADGDILCPSIAGAEPEAAILEAG